MAMHAEEQKPVLIETKSSTEILTELFSSFDVEPPLIIKKEQRDTSKKHKKSKKKHTHKDKKHKKKGKKRHRDRSTEDHNRNTKIKLENSTPPIEGADFLSDQNLTPEIKREKIDSYDEDVTIKTEKQSDIVTPSKNQTFNTSKIKVKSLEFSSIFAATIREIQEKQGLGESEVILEDEESVHIGKKKKKKHSHEKHKKKKHSHSQDRSRSRSKKKKKDEEEALKNDHKSDEEIKKHKHKDSAYKTKYKSKDGYKSDDYYKEKQYRKSSRKNSSHYKENNRCRSQDRDNKHFYDDIDNYRHREKSSRDRSDGDRRYTRDRHRGYSSRDEDYYRHRDTSRDGDFIDKQKLLEIARKNAVQMMKSGNLPGALTLGRQAQEKVLAAIRAGGKSIKELTEFCQALSKQEESAELSEGYANEDRESDSEHKGFHHPFQIKDRPSTIIMNIKNSVPLPTKNAHERNTELRLQFPVSSGSQHRKTEITDVPGSPKKIEAAPVVNISHVSAIPLPVLEAPAIEQAAVVENVEPNVGSPVFPTVVDPNIDISQIVSHRLSAMRKLQENPNDAEALTTMQKSQKEMQSWAESKQVPGQFTGSTGANILSQAELASGYQAWAKKACSAFTIYQVSKRWNS